MTDSLAGDRPLRLAYLMSRFPKATETFVLNEILELEALGHHVEIFPLVREHEAVVQPGVEPLVARAHDVRPLSMAVVRAQLHWLRRRPKAYVTAWAEAITGNLRSPKFLARALVVVPLAATFAERMEGLGIDHIHAHWATHPALAALVAGRLTGRPYSFTAHAHDLYVDRTMLEEKIRRARFVVTISAMNRRLIAGWFGPRAAARITVIHCGVDPAVFAPPAASEPATAEPSTLPVPAVRELVSIASLQPQKGQIHLVRACGLLRDAGRAVHCTLVGDGEERPRLEAEIARLGLADVVTLAGAQPRDRVAKIVRAADVVVQPSVVLGSGKTEGIPVALMEALAAERPVVASRLSGIPELIRDGETGLLVEPGDPAKLADAIARLLDDPAAASRMARAGRELVLREFDLRRNTERLAERFAESRDGRPIAIEPFDADDGAGPRAAAPVDDRAATTA
jgi:glycosyltransferase involved in cell wall biosynthesis